MTRRPTWKKARLFAILMIVLGAAFSLVGWLRYGEFDGLSLVFCGAAAFVGLVVAIVAWTQRDADDRDSSPNS